MPVGWGVKIHFDWRLARVLDEDGHIHDELYWDGRMTQTSIAERLRKMQLGRNTPEVNTLAERFPDAIVDPMGSLSDNDWPEQDPGLNSLFHSAAERLAKMGVADSSGDMDRRLDMLVSSAIELRSSWNNTESRCVEWAGLFITEADLDSQREEIPPSILESSEISVAAEKLGVKKPKHLPSKSEWEALRSLASNVIETSRLLKKQEEAIRELSISYIPSLSALLGPISAAKMVTLAGSRERLARMPSGSLQVLGAHAAMAAHRRGAPPPKHGAILFSLPQVSKSPRWIRGKVARFIAGKASIAVRIDHFGGEPWDSNRVEEIYSEVEVIKKKFPRPPKRR
ncbi:MAG: hypothetical protein CMB67_03815 [Euryarchaeota archaeon]|nr:hypothetical protein [Euryarchaeota archaeon]